MYTYYNNSTCILYNVMLQAVRVATSELLVFDSMGGNYPGYVEGIHKWLTLRSKSCEHRTTTKV